MTATTLTTHRITPPASSPGLGATTTTYAARSLRKFRRTPQLIVVGALTSAMFLLIFRYVFGGAIATGPVSYVNFLIPGLLAAGAMFEATGAAVGVAEDAESGLYDRLRSLPIPRLGVLFGRSLADTGLVVWGTLITLGLGLATGFRPDGGVLSLAAAIALCVLFGSAFTWVFIWMGLVAGNGQAAQGMTFMAFPFVFVSSAYVPVESMPGWMQPVAEHQPITAMVGSVRSLTLGADAEAILGHSTGYYVLRALMWCVAIVAVFAPLAVRRFARQ